MKAYFDWESNLIIAKKNSNSDNIILIENKIVININMLWQSLFILYCFKHYLLVVISNYN